MQASCKQKGVPIPFTLLGPQFPFSGWFSILLLAAVKSVFLSCSTGILFNVAAPSQQMSFMQVHKAESCLNETTELQRHWSLLSPLTQKACNTSLLQADLSKQLGTAKIFHKVHTSYLHPVIFTSLLPTQWVFSLFLIPVI